VQAESEERCKAWTACTAEAQRLAKQFSEVRHACALLLLAGFSPLLLPCLRWLGAAVLQP
jgi:hypothetical protein